MKQKSIYESNSILNNSSVYCYAWFDLNLIIKKVILTNISQSERLNATVRNEWFPFEKVLVLKLVHS